MTYDEWFIQQGNLHANVMKKLEDRSVDEVIEYFKFENMVKNEPDFCPLYKGQKSGSFFTMFSVCSIKSRDGSQFIGDDYIHQNCSGCIVPHRAKYIKKHFNRSWFEVMKDVRG